MSALYKDHTINEAYKDLSLKQLQMLWAQLIGKPLAPRYLLSRSVKILKGEKVGYLTGVQYMTAAAKIGGINTCSHAKVGGCEKWCLVMSGHMAGNRAIESRADRLALLIRDPSLYFEILSREIVKLRKRASIRGMLAAGRLNGTTDLDWARITFNGRTIFEHHSDLYWYDYTKNPNIARAYQERGVSITFSFYRKAKTEDLLSMLDRGINVAIAYRDKLPKVQRIGREELEVINGDEHDLRFLDRRGVIVGLKYKNQTMHAAAREVNQSTEQSGFIVSSSEVL